MMSNNEPDTLPVSDPTESRMRWVMLAVLALGFVAMTFNWFVMPSTFTGIAVDYGVEIPGLALVISVFVIGYGVMHIPAGFIANRLGIRLTIVAGLALEGAFTALVAVSHNFLLLLTLRVLAGFAASIYAGIGIAAASVWFRGREHAFALGVISASFSLGVAAGLYGWVPVVAVLGWRPALVLAGGLAILCALAVLAIYRPPRGNPALHGVRVSRQQVRAVLASPRLWRYGLAFFGGYGAYFAASQLLDVYATQARGFPAEVGALAALLVGIAGIPGSILAGWVADHMRTRNAPFLLFLGVQVVGIVLVPLGGSDFLWLAALLIGLGFNGCFAVWQTVPGDDVSIPPEQIGTAVGLVLTIAAVGGFALPWVFGQLVASTGYTTAWLAIAGLTAVFGLIVVGERAVAPHAAPQPSP
ncbi:MFS transporter [Enemella evansiae]|uniref:MFS transporter n=1 Tax=Enemella evansiae TaxID=2016499 RepID=UPI000B96310B|nr:MFS transporter [Enemella evansiae]OYO06117.1 MFS transporter [Enemella evansiae]